MLRMMSGCERARVMTERPSPKGPSEVDESLRETGEMSRNARSRTTLFPKESRTSPYGIALTGVIRLASPMLPAESRNTKPARSTRTKREVSAVRRRVAPAKGTVLLVDGDAATRKQVESRLLKVSLDLVCAEDTEQALEVLRRRFVDLILCETLLVDGPGIAFLRHLEQHPHFARTPFIFYSADTRPQTRAVAFRAGAYNYIEKPAAADEFTALVESVIRRNRRDAESWGGTPDFSGRFETMTLAQLVMHLEKAGRTGKVTITTPQARGLLMLEGGNLVHSIYGNLVGNAAFLHMLSRSEGSFEFVEEALSVRIDQWTVTAPASVLINQATNGAPEPAPPSASLRKGTLPPERRLMMARLEPSAMRAVHFAAGIQDPFLLGDLELRSFDELREWTLNDSRGDRFHVLYVDDLVPGIVSTMELASAPTERLILRGIDGAELSVGLTFNLRNDRVLDVTLVDVQRIGAFRAALKRVPALVVVACGASSLGPRNLAQLDDLLNEVAPPIVLSTGDEHLAQSLSEIATPGKGRPPIAHVDLNGGSLDLRAVLLEGISRWGRLGGLSPEK